MKDCFLTASVSRNAGGLHQAVRDLARASLALNRDVCVLGTQDEHTAADIESWKPVSVQALPTMGPERFSFAPGLNRKLAEACPDLVQLHGLWRYTSLVASRWHRRTGKPYIVHPHGMLDPWAVRNSRWKKILAEVLVERVLLREASCIRALCESEADAIRKHGCRNPICIIPNGMDLPLAIGEKSTVTGPLHKFKEAGRKVLLYLGRIHPKKGLSNLLTAWAAFKHSQSSEWILAIAGWDDGGHEAELKRQARELGLMDSVVFIGPQFGENKAGCYQQCDAFVLPSFSEGLPMVVLEAWSYGKPVVMTPECNLPEGFAANAAIRIAPETRGISDGLVKLAGFSPAELSEMGQNGFQLVARQFTWGTIARQLQAVCDWLINGASKPDCVRLN